MMTHEMETVRFWEHVTDADRWYTAVLVINGLFYFYFLLVEIVQWHQLGSRKYWFDTLNIVQMFNVLFFVIHVSLRYVVIDVVPDPIVVESSDFYELNPAVRVNKVAVATMAVNVFLNWFKLIAYLSLNPTFAMMANTLSRAAGGCCGFFGIFCIILYGFAQSHAMVFQGRVYAFRTVGQTTFALLRSLLGDFDFAQLQESHAFMGPFFFISFVLIAVFVVLNMCVCFRPTHAAGGFARSCRAALPSVSRSLSHPPPPLPASRFIAIISNAYNDSHREFRNAPSVAVLRESTLYIMDVLVSLPVIGRYFKATGQKVLHASKVAVRTPKSVFRKITTKGAAVAPSREGSPLSSARRNTGGNFSKEAMGPDKLRLKLLAKQLEDITKELGQMG